MNNVVLLNYEDAQTAENKALEIFEYLGRGFFSYLKHYSDHEVVKWITWVLQEDQLRVEFNDPNDALMFKLAVGGL